MNGIFAEIDAKMENHEPIERQPLSEAETNALQLELAVVKCEQGLGLTFEQVAAARRKLCAVFGYAPPQ